MACLAKFCGTRKSAASESGDKSDAAVTKSNSKMTKSNQVSTVADEPTRNSCAIVECPVANLVGRTSDISTASRMSLKNKDVDRPSIAIPICPEDPTIPVAVSALEVCPASPEREKLIELYCYTHHAVKNANNIKVLQKFMQGIEREAVTLCVNPEAPLDDETRTSLRTTCHFQDESVVLSRHQKSFSIVGLRDGVEYLSDARDKVDAMVGGENKFIVAMTACSDTHNQSLIEDINGINVLISAHEHDTSSISKPKGVPFVQLDSKHIAHISIGFDDYGQYEIRRSDMIDYEKYLRDLGLLEFLEEDEENAD